MERQQQVKKFYNFDAKGHIAQEIEKLKKLRIKKSQAFQVRTFL